MSLLQPRTPLRKWLRTQSVQPQLSQLILPQNTTQRQAFHASPSRSAAKQSPAAKRARTRGNIPGALGDNNVVTYHHPIQNLARVHYTTTLEEQINNFNRTGAAFWASATKEGILDPNLSLYTFMEVGRKLLETGFEKEASAVAIRKISTDVELVFRISFVVSRFFPYLYSWAVAACAQAGSKTAIICAAHKYLFSNRTATDLKTPLLNDVKRIAIEDRNPSAIILHAWVLNQRQQFQESAELLHPLIETMTPVRDSRFADLILEGIPKPWTVYTQALYKLGREEEANEVHRRAATEFNDPDSAIIHAKNLVRSEGDSQKHKEDFTQYLQLMGIAATGGNGDACCRLGNYYYLRYLHLNPYNLDYVDSDPNAEQPKENKVALAETRVAEEKKAGTWAPYAKPRSILQYIRYYLCIDRSRDDYYKLAMEWYSLGANLGNPKAAFLVARLLKLDKQDEQAHEMLNIAQGDQEYQSRVKKLRMEGANPSIRDDLVEL